ncbi:GntR family transcriptional regulator [Caballeronia sp. BCC1704]|uniref:GntR family transcriptional regulator n=1 Tax=Caballeronia sp. BCC1704 TaxID=2676300 RepID=UPI00158B4EAD|nr:GntR family transcriptional regulator [Caballeronia sp. BCC1704]
MPRYSSLLRETRPNVRETTPPKRPGLTVNELYEQLKEMAVVYTIRPGERVNELELAQRFDVSRTPLREALNRLVAESLLHFVPNRGFFARELHRQDIFDLFELRRSIESSAVLLAAERASIKDLRALRKFWKEVMKTKAQTSAAELTIKDEEFHVRLVALAGNNEMVRALYGINARIHFVRWMDLEQRGHDAFAEHLDILDAIEARDIERCRALTESHITWRMEEIARVVDAGVVRLFSR